MISHFDGPLGRKNFDFLLLFSKVMEVDSLIVPSKGSHVSFKRLNNFSSLNQRELNLKGVEG